MAKWCGKVGYAVSTETAPGIYSDRIVERVYYGDLIRNTSRWQNGESANDDLNISNQISILADQFAYQNFHSIKYVEFMDANWKITNVEVQHPRLILMIGGLYNGK